MKAKFNFALPLKHQVLLALLEVCGVIWVLRRNAPSNEPPHGRSSEQALGTCREVCLNGCRAKTRLRESLTG